MKASLLIQKLKQDSYRDLFLDLYQDPDRLESQKTRYIGAVETFVSLYGDKDVSIVSTSGRSEISGNHTDHQHGKVIAASLNLDAIAVCAPCEEAIRIVSDGNRLCEISVSDLSLKEEEYGTSEALVRGVTARRKELNHAVGGFEAYVTSDVLIGSGMSSSACFENLIGTIHSVLYGNGFCDTVEIAKIYDTDDSYTFVNGVLGNVAKLIAADKAEKDEAAPDKAASDGDQP